MPEEGTNFESFTGSPSGKEKVSETQEQFNERYRQAQAAVQQIKREESVKKAQDNTLAQIIVQFMGQDQSTPYFLLISRLTARNIPSSLILVMIALIFEPAAKALGLEPFGMATSSNALRVDEKNGLFSKWEKQNIDRWTNTIASIAHRDARKVLLTALGPDETPNSGLIRLFALLLRDFLESQKHEDVALQNLDAFGKVFFGKVFADLRKAVGNEHLLKEK